MKQTKLFNQFGRNEEMKNKPEKTKRASQEQLFDLCLWLPENKESLNGKTQKQIERILHDAGFLMPWNAIKNALDKYDVYVKRKRISRTANPLQPMLNNKIEHLKSELSIEQNRVDELEIKLQEVCSMLLNISQVLIKTPPFTIETRNRFVDLRDDIKRTIKNAEQRSRQQRQIHANAGRNSVADLPDSTAVESSNGTTSVASRLATTNAGDSSRNSNHQIGG